MYCSVVDVGLRLGLNSSQRQQANTKILAQIRRASIEIDQEFNYYGRTCPAQEIGETTLNGAVAAGATPITLTSGTDFATEGKGNIYTGTRDYSMWTKG